MVPVLEYATFFGGSGPFSHEAAHAIAVDESGSVYLAGTADADDFVTSDGSFQEQFGGFSDAFVIKLNPDGRSIAYSTFLGGRFYDEAFAIAVDAHGAAYVTGMTQSDDFPTTRGAYEQEFTGEAGNDSTVFVAKISPDGSTLDFSTLLAGGDNAHIGTAIAVDASGASYVTGYTNGVGFPTTSGAYVSRGYGFDVFVTKLNPTGSSLVFSSVIGGSSEDYGTDIVVDVGGAIYVGGSTSSPNYPAVGVQFDDVTNLDNRQAALVMKFSPDASRLLIATVVGGSNSDACSGIAVDAGGNIYGVGATASSDFPTTAGAIQEDRIGFSFEAFVFKLSPSASTILYATYMGGEIADAALRIAIDDIGRMIVAGYTESPEFPLTDTAIDSQLSFAEAFVSIIDATGTTLEFSTFLGGSEPDFGLGLALDDSGGIYVCGQKMSPDFATTGFGVHEASSAFVAKLQLTPRTFEITSCDPSSGARRAKLDLTIAGDLFQTGATVNLGDGIKIRSVDVVSQRVIRVRIKVKKNAVPGPRDVTITNPDGSVAVLAGAFQIRS